MSTRLNYMYTFFFFKINKHTPMYSMDIKGPVHPKLIFQFCVEARGAKSPFQLLVPFLDSTVEIPALMTINACCGHDENSPCTSGRLNEY